MPFEWTKPVQILTAVFFVDKQVDLSSGIGILTCCESLKDIFINVVRHIKILNPIVVVLAFIFQGVGRIGSTVAFA